MKTITEYTAISSNWIKVITKDEAYNNKTDNIYYLDYVRADKDYSNWQRAKDDDIVYKDMFVIDIDLRSNCGYEITNEDIIQEWLNIIENLEKEDEYFWEWAEIVFTWNWLHIKYYWEPTEFTKEEYSMWVNRIYKQWDNFWWASEFISDKACKNLARILRLPWSINQKNWAEVKILAKRDKKSRLFGFIKWLAKKELIEKQEQDEKRKQELEEQMKKYWNEWNDLYIKFNQIPAYQIAQLLIPEFPYDWKKNFKNKKWWFTGYFYNKDNNTIVNWGSRYFDWGDDGSGWNNFSLLKRFKNLTDKQTFLLIKEILW